ncbi:MAG TPA: hypothetical protein VKZ53_20225 [Candidatus Angelobacter sp.]|nr:hypothetical protein [Candidatus Angelobacter sp.]
MTGMPPFGRNRKLLLPVLVGTLVFVLLAIIYWLSIEFGLSERQRIVDDLLGGVVAGLLVYWAERRWAAYLSERLRMIRLVNHHVRNALQTIKYAHYIEDSKQQIEIIEQSVARIEWTLREILPSDNASGESGETGLEGPKSA